MTPLNRDLFIKLMAKTTSDSDSEALAFLRKANAMLKAANITWSEIVSDQAKAERKLFEAFTYADLRRNVRDVGPSRYGRPVRRTKTADKGRNTDRDIGPMLDALRTREHTMGFIMFLSGVTKQWKDHGYLTDAQLEAVRKAYTTGRSAF